LAVAPLAGLGFRGISVAVCPVRLEPCQWPIFIRKT
jgi:hypothetical protein